MLTLITGGARSGKSTFAQSLCGKQKKIIYIATARETDGEMAARIQIHRASRPADWLTVEEPLRLGEAAYKHAGMADFLLIDCLTVWLSNLLFEHRGCPQDDVEAAARGQVDRVVDAASRCSIIAVTNEVGSGIVPISAVARQFRDLQGMVNQHAAAQAETVFLMTCGIPMQVKPSPLQHSSEAAS